MPNEAMAVKEMKVAAVRKGGILQIAADRATVERCKTAISQFGALAPPVVAELPDGSSALLSGECEFAALKETGARTMQAATARVPEGGEAKASLLLSSLRKGPGALCEGMLLREALEGGASRAEIGRMLGRSASWMSNRMALATRLDKGVRDLLERGLLEARSAQEIARLAPGEQYAFAEMAVRENLPKSAVEALVAGYKDRSCPSGAKEQMLRDPKAALARVSDTRRAVKGGGIGARIEDARTPLSRLAQALCLASPADASPHRHALTELAKDLRALLDMAGALIYPGKGVEACHAD